MNVVICHRCHISVTYEVLKSSNSTSRNADIRSGCFWIVEEYIFHDLGSFLESQFQNAFLKFQVMLFVGIYLWTYIIYEFLYLANFFLTFLREFVFGHGLSLYLLSVLSWKFVPSNTRATDYMNNLNLN